MPEVIEQTFSVGEAPRLSLANIRGSVEILPGTAGQISVRAEKHNGGDAEHTVIEMKQAEDGEVSVRTLYNYNGWRSLFGGTPCKVDYKVQVPSACGLKVEGVSNSAALQGVNGEIKATSVSGKMTLKDLSGQLALTTVSGGIAGERLSGSLRLETVSGGVELIQCDLPSLDCSTVSGGITVETSLGQGDYHFNSVSGEIRMVVPAASNCTVYSSSISGNVHSDLPVTSNRLNGKHVWQVACGGTAIRHNSVSGGFWLKVRPEEAHLLGPAAEKDARIEPEAAATPDRLAVLEQIERGELSVEDGLKILAPK